MTVDEITVRTDAATPAPWLRDDGPDGQWDRVLLGGGYSFESSHDRRQAQLDAEFIAHARSDVPWLLARVRELKAALRGAREGFVEMHHAGWDNVRRDVATAAIEQIDAALAAAGGTEGDTP